MSKVPPAFRRRLQKKVRRIYRRGYVRAVRTSDRVGGPPLVSLVVKLLLVWELLQRASGYRAFKQTRAVVPAPFRRGSALAHFYRTVRDWQETLVLALLYDRLDALRWRARMRWTSALPESDGRPVVLAFLHHGSYGVLRYWLRARRVPVATLVWVLPELLVQHGQTIRAAGDEAYGLAGVPHAFTYNGELRAAARFLRPGRMLAMALDGKAVLRLPVRYEANGRVLYLNDGAVRMAQMRNAILLPVTIRRESAFRFAGRFGAPVPDALVQAADPGAAMRHLVAHFWTELENDPAALSGTALQTFEPHHDENRIMRA